MCLRKKLNINMFPSVVFIEDNSPRFYLKTKIMSFLSVYFAAEVFPNNTNPSRIVVFFEGLFNLRGDLKIRYVRIVYSLNSIYR